MSAEHSAGAPAPPLPDPRAVLNSIGECVYNWCLVSDELTWGPNAGDVLHLSEELWPVSGRAYAARLAGSSPTSRYDAIMNHAERDLGSGARYRCQYGMMLPAKGRDGDVLTWIEDTGRWFAGADGRPAHAHGLIRIITERYEGERELSARSTFDMLTGALNRVNLVEQLARICRNAGKARGSFALLLAGIENLFVINRTYGYDIADEVIVGVAQRIRTEMRATDVIGRYAGNKFAIALESCDIEQMRVAADRFIDVVAQPIMTSAGPIPVALRIGGVLGPRHGRTPQPLLQHAEEALDLARGPGGPRLAVYEPNLPQDDARMRALAVAEEIVSALNARRIVLAYQPIVEARTGAVVYYEALLRLKRADGTIAEPAAILPLAEKAGLVSLLDQRVLELAVVDLAERRDLHLAVNVSSVTVHDAEWPTRLKAVVQANPGVAERLTLEMTETAAIADIARTREAISAVRALGIKFAIDDFGSGHTSFRTLRTLGADLLKIDGAFMENLARSPDDRYFVRTLVGLARHLNVPTVAEWVEDEASATLLTEWGVDYLQGHLYGRAVLSLPEIDVPGAGADTAPTRRSASAA